jgi:hypothetical protein
MLTKIHSTIYAAFVVLSVYSLIPTTAQKEAHAARKAEKKAEKEKWASSPYDNEMTAEDNGSTCGNCSNFLVHPVPSAA